MKESRGEPKVAHLNKLLKNSLLETRLMMLRYVMKQAETL